MINKKDCVIVVPIYRDYITKFEEISLQRITTIFSKRDIVFVCPRKLKIFATRLALNHGIGLRCEFFEDKYFKGITGYNRLMISEIFFNRFSEYSWIQICQLDVLVIKDDLNYWMNEGYSNIGAPVFEKYCVDKSMKFKEFGSNGGFCLRKTESCIRVLKSIGLRYAEFSPLWRMEKTWHWRIYRVFRDWLIFNYKFSFLQPRLNEDMFWSLLAPQKFKWFKIAPPEIQAKFAYDNHPRELLKMCGAIPPMAIHAWWRYDFEFVRDEFLHPNEIDRLTR